MNYEEVLEFLYENLPFISERDLLLTKGTSIIRLALDLMFGHPHRSFRTIHVAEPMGKVQYLT